MRNEAVAARPTPPKRFHDLRHTSVTLLLWAGVDVHRAQRILRHGDVRTTTGIHGASTRRTYAEDLRGPMSQWLPAGVHTNEKAGTAEISPCESGLFEVGAVGVEPTTPAV